MKSSIVIATYNKLEYTKQCIESIRAYTSPDSYEIIVVDNHSSDDTIEWLKGQTDIKLICNQENMGFPKACNQGIEIATGNNILLLNNDTIVTPGWLDNLTSCLYSSSTIGAVGPVTNSCSNLQQIPVSYNSIDSMIDFATQYNQSNPQRWEERLRLIGYCMLIKKHVVDEIGLLDERFTPGNCEDDDYSHRLRLAGYRLMVCSDTFIHHFGSTSFKDNANEYGNLIRTNRQKYFAKWGYDPFVGFTKWTHLVDLIDQPRDTPVRVLEIGCHCGETLLSVKARYPNAELYAIEPNANEAANATSFAQVKVQTISTLHDIYENDFFDVIIMGEGFHEVMNLDNLKVVVGYLKKHGQFISLVPNIMHYEVIRDTLKGIVKRTQLKALTYSEILELMQAAGFQQIKINAVKTEPLKLDDPIHQTLSILNPGMDLDIYETQYFLLNACLKNDNDSIGHFLEGLAKQVDNDFYLRRLKLIEQDDVISFIENNYENAPLVLNFVGIQFLEAKENDYVLPYLQRAFELEPGSTGTIFNMGLAMYSLGHDELALEWWEQVQEKDTKLLSWMENIRSDIKQRQMAEYQTTFLLRRIEFGYDVEESLEELLGALNQGEVLLEEVIEKVERDIIHKDDVLNSIAVTCFNKGLVDFVFPLFERSISLNPYNKESLYNIGYVMHVLGENENALSYLKGIEEPDEQALELMDIIRERVSHE